MSETTNSKTDDKITFEEFSRIQLRVGRVIEARNHPNADKLLVLKVDLGGEQRQVCAGIRGHYTPEELIGRNLVLVANLAPRTMRGEVSDGMLLAATSADRTRVVMVTTERDIEPGVGVS